MRISLIFDLEKMLFFPYLPPPLLKLSYEVEIWYTYLVGALDVSLGFLTFQFHFSPSQPQRNAVLVGFF